MKTRHKRERRPGVQFLTVGEAQKETGEYLKAVRAGLATPEMRAKYWDGRTKIIRSDTDAAPKSLDDYLAKHPHVDSDLFTADGDYLPALRFGKLRYDLKKLGKFLFNVLGLVLNPEEKK